jgi:hypothetical protein
MIFAQNAAPDCGRVQCCVVDFRRSSAAAQSLSPHFLQSGPRSKPHSTYSLPSSIVMAQQIPPLTEIKMIETYQHASRKNISSHMRIAQKQLSKYVTCKLLQFQYVRFVDVKQSRYSF